MRICTFICAEIMIVICCASAFAQSKFDRPKAKAAKTENAQLTNNSATPDKKVDVSDLENRYWQEKDTQFNVVQNRLYTKSKRFSATATIGTVVNDAYTNNFNFGLMGHYYFSEREGLELSAWRTSTTDSDLVARLAQAGLGNAPNRNIPYAFLGANYVWVPIYAKMSLLEKKIIYFDMSVAPGLGVTWVKSAQTSSYLGNPAQKDQYAVTLALDLAQQFFLSEHLALRLDLKNHFYQEQLYDNLQGTALNSRFNYSCSVMLGVTYFLDTPASLSEGKKQ